MKLSRRGFVIKFFLGVLGLFFLDAFWLEQYFIEWNIFDISNGNQNKIKAIQLSDLHLKEIKKVHKPVAKRINKELPDVLLITGDSITRNSRIPLLSEFLSLLDYKIKKIAILGNKEYSGRVNLKDLRETLESHNGILLINESYVFDIKSRKINILGVDDFVFGKPDFARASQDIDYKLPTVVLNHCPAYRKTIDEISSSLDIKPTILSGHTHGGQITFFGRPLMTPYGSGEYVKGWYPGETSQMYVSKGVGTTILPIRFGARAEASILYF
ncbi:metallophosphoesterase [Maribacter polysiphoniae]|uniref:Metallophosphoesterase n=1 Tax=Maribacter polysiphoniae TaxID=429344 RepID=A0A316E4E7_9FLAO|nr:metallophosphoesterase [Maribacter polysiphoniae]MBD1261175.1 metallophosphoesterase [Maribacter polysiphoniae]PWK23583.1 hypothetical protein LX92_02149 [Maribacter polysiphoniae]